MCLAPRQAAAARSQAASASSGDLTSKIQSALQKQINDLQNQNKQLKQAKQQSQPAQPDKVRKGNLKQGKGAGRDSKVRLPPALQGMSSVSTAATGKKRLCFGFNLGNCTGAAPGEECQKGFHLCMKPGCSKPHPCTKCTV